MVDTPDKEMALVAYAFNFPMRDDPVDFPSLKLANYIFGEHMNSRLVTRIREKEGISYGAGSFIEISRHEEHASLGIYAMASPEAIARAQRAIEEEWMQFINDGIHDKELQTAKASMYLGFENNLASDSFLVNALAYDLECGRDFYAREGLLLAIKELSAVDVKRSLETWWSHAQFSKVIAADHKKRL